MQQILATLIIATSLAFHQGGAAGETPTQFYTRYRAAIPSAKTVDQITRFWSDAQRKEFNAAPAAERMGLDELKAAYRRQTDVKVVKEAVTPSSATLTIEAITSSDKRLIGTAELVRENGAWRMTGPESWTEK